MGLWLVDCQPKVAYPTRTDMETIVTAIPDPKKAQVGGSHYKGLLIEPLELTYANQYDGLIFTILKYVMRHHLKGGAVDLDKAAHACHYRAAMIREHGFSPRALNVFPPERVIFANKMKPLEGRILTDVHAWSRLEMPMSSDDSAAMIAASIIGLRDTRYPR